MVTVKNVMNRQVASVDISDSVQQAALHVARKRATVLVVTKNKRPVGVISSRDFIKRFYSGGKKPQLKDMMTKNFVEISNDTSFFSIEQNIRKDTSSCYVITHGGVVEGIIVEADVLNAARSFTRMQLIIQDSILIIFGIITLLSFILLVPWN